MKKQLPNILFDKYLNGTCNPQEEAIVREWYNTFVNDDDHISSFSSQQKADLKIRIRKAIDENIALQQKTQFVSTITKKTPWLRYLTYSGSIAAIVLFAFGINFLKENYAHNSARTLNTSELISITNRTKSIQERVLSDGSHVWLYPGAQITFAGNFSGKTREVKMSGEVFFDVAKNAQKPFIIYSEHILTKVWGTSFRVRDSRDAAYADVAVVTGKVSVKTLQSSSKPEVKEVMLHPNEQVTWLKQHDVLKSNKKVNAKELSIWKKINLSFDNNSIKEVIPVLNKHFNVHIVSTDEKLNSYLLNADFNGLNFASIMEIMKKTLNISYEINGANIILKNNN